MAEKKTSFRERHPFLTLLLKIVAVIVVSFGTLIGSFVMIFLFLFIIAAVGTVGSDDLEIGLPRIYKSVYGDTQSQNKLLSIPLSGVILGDRETVDPLSFLDVGIIYGYEIKRALYDAVEDDSIKGVILEVNSPGGTIFGSRAIADGVTYYKQKTGNPVIAMVSGLSASGGYYAVASTDAIYADYGSTIGSIGVIMGPFKYYDGVRSEDGGILLGGVVTQNGIETTYITGGASKDLGNPYRQLTDLERQILQRQIDNEYDLFVDYVSQNRKISEDTLKNQIGALIYDNTLAAQYKLIDKTMNKETAYADLAKRSDIDGDNFVVIRERNEPSFVQAIFQTALPSKTVPHSLCPLSSNILAYHGNVTALCHE